LEDLWIAAGSTAAGGDAGAGQEAQFHQAARIVGGQVNLVQDGGVAPAQVNQSAAARVRFGQPLDWRNFRSGIVDTQLHLDFSMPWSEMGVKGRLVFFTFLVPHVPRAASNLLKYKDNRMDPQFSIRPARASDLDGILEIEHASFGRDAYDRNLFAELLQKCERLFLVAYRPGSGVFAYMVTCAGRGGAAEVVSVAVDPKRRGKGAASELMESTLRRLRRRGVGRVWLTVRMTNRRAVRFYEKYRFRKVRVVRGYYGEGRDGWGMERVVGPPGPDQ